MNDPVTLKLLEAFAESARHSKRMVSARDKILMIFPLSVSRYSILTDDEIEHIDQMIYRFSKLQDAIGDRLFKAMLMFLEEDTKNKSFLDVLNRLEQIEILQSREEWLRLRRLRNELSHEYSHENEENVAALNLLFDAIKTINGILLGIKNYFDLHIRHRIDEKLILQFNLSC